MVIPERLAVLPILGLTLNTRAAVVPGIVTCTVTASDELPDSVLPFIVASMTISWSTLVVPSVKVLLPLATPSVQ